MSLGTVTGTLLWVNPNHYAECRNQVERLRKGWAARELQEWNNHGGGARELEIACVGLPAVVAELVRGHAEQDMGECECCRVRAPLRLISDGTESGESDWRCSWGCPPPEEAPTETRIAVRGEGSQHDLPSRTAEADAAIGQPEAAALPFAEVAPLGGGYGADTSEGEQ